MKSSFLKLPNLLLAIALFLSACASPPVAPVGDAGRGMIVGHIGAPHGIKAVYLHAVGKAYIGAINMPRAHIQRNGNFMFVNLAPGRYYLAGFDDGTAPYWIPHDKESIRRAGVELKPGGLLYIGSYRVANVEAPVWGRGSFDFERVRTPSERTILQELRPMTEGSGWDTRIDKRLKSAY